LFDATGRLTGAVNMLVDVSERRRAEQDNQRLAAIVDASEDAIISKDLGGLITSWNSGAERLFGYAKQEVIGKSITLVIPPHLRDEEAAIIDQIARGERIEHFETARVRKDGTLVSVSLSISPVRSGHGTVVGASTIARDIAKKTEAALRESETRLAGQRRALELALNGEPLAISLGVLVRAATDQLGEGVRAAFYLANPAHTGLHHVVGMSDAYAEAVDGFEIGPASLSCGLATHTGLPILTPDVAKEPRWTPWLWLAEKFDFRGCWSFPIRTETGRFVGTLAIYWRRPREATPRELELAAVLTATAAIIIARHTDAEQRDRALAALRESEERLRESNAQLALAGRAALVSTHAYDADLERMTVSEGYAAIHGLPEGIKETTRTEWRARVHPDDLGRLDENRARAFRDRRDVYNVDYRIVRANGEVRWIEARGIVSYDSAGHPQRVIGLDLAKKVFQVHGVDAEGKVVVARKLRRKEVLAFFGAYRFDLAYKDHQCCTCHNGQALIALITDDRRTVLHELVTNAAKYGALSNRNGRVSVQCHRLSGFRFQGYSWTPADRISCGIGRKFALNDFCPAARRASCSR
jgi:PAS domain S-box-containing protein